MVECPNKILKIYKNRRQYHHINVHGEKEKKRQKALNIEIYCFF